MMMSTNRKREVGWRPQPRDTVYGRPGENFRAPGCRWPPARILFRSGYTNKYSAKAPIHLRLHEAAYGHSEIHHSALQKKP